MNASVRRIHPTKLSLVQGGKKSARKAKNECSALFLTLIILLLASLSQTLQIKALQSDMQLLEERFQLVGAECERTVSRSKPALSAYTVPEGTTLTI